MLISVNEGERELSYLFQLWRKPYEKEEKESCDNNTPSCGISVIYAGLGP